MTLTEMATNVVSRDFVADHTIDRDQRPMLGGPNKFKVAIFGANVTTGQGGLNLAENTIRLGNWGEVHGLAQKADRYGVDGFIPIARWQGLSGPDRPWGRQFETFTWAAGLAAATQNIQIFATCLIPFIHPIVAAKMVATVDHISGGRIGLNATAGYFKPEYAMFGIPVPEHDIRYELADEWMSIVERLWSDDEVEFNFDGDFFHLEGAQSWPKPVQRPGPMVMSAGSSPAGQQFAIKHANILFAAISSVDRSFQVTPKLRENANAAGREDLGLWAGVHIICKDTEKEARDYLNYVEEKGDYESALKYKHIIQNGDSRGFNWDHYKTSEDPTKDETIKTFFRAGLVPLVGTPEMIVDGLQKLYDSGITGICTGLVDYDEGLDRMNEQIFPLMRGAGLRV
ncbi:Flavin-dependent oxidoreductase, luciferase family (includes alkanesulfonate monooxygenase SsuD and methylene tetrahydromethanopterin reductase) [Rhizobium mongolense subsp. loessense]|uniref:Flavin-dependent oxidoreductase, luciferase family (Includes alkanesulfonate monooxygenase SsuD and methylene tetrahydromethanopterin reductase) n=1 Tax=Rhizobium mongolense subsp. loessense TaxID=158890 RepID=A0A1G4TQ66_9HYPH|nr:LLM class flavin-dependent oxidoreductase [Rhizobium mongolense]NRP90607.1 Pyrimidine monooxygenase RutA [Ensifer adhaerens]SCW83563.1 Flavin-dependent oxidoreductase, luciferase family (includes alkanesulfonate monooxygenase SsuD and methylene tetrahydromethanopterin reductase) [Rhizobium mongolense subsp. loessense]